VTLCHVWERKGLCMGFWWGNLNLEDLGVNGEIITRQSPKIWKILIHVPPRQACRTINSNKYIIIRCNNTGLLTSGNSPTRFCVTVPNCSAVAGIYIYIYIYIYICMYGRTSDNQEGIPDRIHVSQDRISGGLL
jgi:hypothetical protein